MNEPPHPILAKGKVRYVGDHVAMVVAETEAVAEEARDLIDIEYSDLPAVTGFAAATAPGAAELHAGVPGNIAFEFESGDAAAASELFLSVLAEEPTHLGALAGLAKLHLVNGDLEGARAVLAQVPEDKRQDTAVSGVQAAIDLADQSAALGDVGEIEARLAANPNDHQARFDLALALAAHGEGERATDELIEIIRRDRTWNDDGARRQLLLFFEAWGHMDELSKSGRRKLSTVLFR
jgi:putative thioredoxin